MPVADAVEEYFDSLMICTITILICGFFRCPQYSPVAEKSAIFLAGVCKHFSSRKMNAC